jgi:hypothetical protein
MIITAPKPSLEPARLQDAQFVYKAHDTAVRREDEAIDVQVDRGLSDKSSWTT